MESDGGMSMKSRVYHTPDKDRTEMGGAAARTVEGTNIPINSRTA